MKAVSIKLDHKECQTDIEVSIAVTYFLKGEGKKESITLCDDHYFRIPKPNKRNLEDIRRGKRPKLKAPKLISKR
ncbi:MAG: hypothetical protein Q8Q08_13035 [Candidatus Omnitrophota bacterium]|nr:hypothetical protein [Candidatus Omnitrophota bacterium]